TGKTEGRGAHLLDRLPRRLHDRRERRVTRGVRPELDRQEGRQPQRVHPLESALEFARDLHAAPLDRDARDDAGMGQAEDSGQEAARRGIHIIIRLHAGEDEIVGSVRTAAARSRAFLPASKAAGSSHAIRTASSAPFASASRSICSVRFGPRVTATTRPPFFSFSRTASSRAYSSAPFSL